MGIEAPLHLAREFMGTTQPDVMLPSQYFAPRRKQAPEQRLMIAVLQDALDCLEKHRFATDCRDRRLFDEAKDWFLAHESGWPYSFESICGVLDLDADAVRRSLRVTPQFPNGTRIAVRTLFPESLAALRCWQFDPKSDGAFERKARAVWKSQANGWDEV